MARTRLSPDDLRNLRDLAAQWGKIVARRAFGDQGPGLDVDFTALEEVALEAARGLTEGTLATLLEQQAQALGPEQPCPDCGRPCPVGRAPRPLHLKGGQPVRHDEPVGHCPACRRDFFPLRPVLRLDGHGYSPALFHQIVEAAAQLKSFQQASLALSLLGGLDISPRHVGRLTRAVGAELARARDEQAVQRRRRELEPRVAAAPAVAVVEIDGGRLFTRQPGCGPGVHQAQAKEDKIACLLSMQSGTHPHDPQPVPPPAFLDQPRVARLVQRLHGHAGGPAPAPAEPEEEAEGPPATDGGERWRGAPERLVRTCVATMQDSRAFGPMVAGEAQARDLYAATRRAFLGDGQQYNWAIQRGYFPDFEPINDFVHVLCYLYLVAWVAGGARGCDEPRRWAQYEQWLGRCWRGQTGEVIEEMAAWQEGLGRPPPGEELDEQDPRRVVAEALTYLRNNWKRMDYPRYRRQGLPVTSSLVESLVGEFNARIKGKDKHWDRPEGAEAILQVRAAVLSQDDRLARHFATRPGNPYRRPQHD